MLQGSGAGAMSGRVLGIIGQDPSVSKSNRLHAVILSVFF